MALYIPYSIFHLARLLYVRPETFGPYYVHSEAVTNVAALGRGGVELALYFVVDVPLT